MIGSRLGIPISSVLVTEFFHNSYFLLRTVLENCLSSELQEIIELSGYAGGFELAWNIIQGDFQVSQVNRTYAARLRTNCCDLKQKNSLMGVIILVKRTKLRALPPP